MATEDSTGERTAQQRFGTMSRAASFLATQVLSHLNQEMCDFVARQDMVFIATADAQGACDSSFRAGATGFVYVLDQTTLAYPEYRGNGVFASIGNILENAHIGLLFLDFTRTTIGLHVNGRARVLTSQEALELPHVPSAMRNAVQVQGGRRPEAWVIIDVEQAYVHCAKHVPLMQRVDKHIAWGSDDETVKGGNFFAANSISRP
ncbi:hydrolase [Nitrospira sp.]|nr:hydrolase [Nitrospira sp.]